MENKVLTVWRQQRVILRERATDCYPWQSNITVKKTGVNMVPHFSWKYVSPIRKAQYESAVETDRSRDDGKWK